ncbi:hypothetical protein FACS18949_16120 [Clostridia bacterium]|nr:hypothetical protein FACS18949_16120 [Clostridia bacterium]
MSDLWQKFIDQAGAYYTSPARAATLLLPIIAAFLVIWWCYRIWFAKPKRGDPKMKAQQLESLETWAREGDPGPFGIPKPGRLGRKDWLPMLAVTAVYAVAAFVFPGALNVPQSFWKADSTNYIAEFEFDRAVELKEVAWYTGSYHGDKDRTHYRLEFSADGVRWDTSVNLTQEYSRTFAWHTIAAPEGEFSYLRLTAVTRPLELGELFLVKADGTLAVPIGESPLFDEQGTYAPNRENTPNNGTYFDEIYHARAAYEMINGVYPYENTHPPLGKEIIAVGIKLFGMNPFGWRFMGILFGILMLPLMYILLKQLFNNTLIAAFGTAIWATDFMHFTQTHIATIDTYNVFFVLLMFIFIHRWMAQPHDTPFLYTLPPLFFCGLSFGLGAAAKWSSVYAGLGLVALYVWKLVARAKWQRVNGIGGGSFTVPTLAVSVVFFLVVPFWLYMASYIPYVIGEQVTLARLWDVMKANQISMFNYHSSLKDTHSYAARWYLWLLDIRPICYFYRNNSGSVAVIDAWNNPILSWAGLMAIITAVIDVFKRRSFHAAFAVVGFLSVMLPWMVVSRITFPYHYFPANIFLIVALGYLLKRAYESMTAREVRNHAIILAAVSALVFLLFFPAVSGVSSPIDFTHLVLQWFPSWPF